MTNLNDYVIVPWYATPTMCEAMKVELEDVFSSGFRGVWRVALLQSPPHNLTIIPKPLIQEVLDMIDAIHSEPANMPHTEAHLNIIKQLMEMVK